MRLFPFTLIKKESLKKLAEDQTLLQSQIASAADFIKEIENGNLDARYHAEEALSIEEADNHLAISLVSLRDQMVRVALEEKQRSWVAETRSKFIDILRSKNNDLRELADDIIRHLVKNLAANQGGLYLVNDDNADDIHIELLACYAYERKKYISQRIEIGQGLVGQTILEKESTYLTEIPENYLRITSGLGKSTPRHLLIVPLKLEEKVFGAIEIASFHPMQDYEIEFAEQLGESIASTIANVKNGQRNKQLLEETQQQAEEMRAQEEEVRQNMEELSATQEEMQRVMKEMQNNEAFVKGLIDATNDTIIAIDKDYKIISCNKATIDSYKDSGLKVGKGFDIFKLLGEGQREKYKTYYDRALQGEYFEVNEHYKFGEREQYFAITYSPLRDDKGEIIGAACFGKDITETVGAKEKAETLLKETQQQTEELLAQEEEMRQNMEELSATQEDMQRVMTEMQASEHYLSELLNVTQDTLYTLDKAGKIISFNTYFEQSMAKYGFKIEKGFDYIAIQPSEKEQNQQQEIINKVFTGETVEVPLMYEVEGGEIHLINTYSPVRNREEKIIAVAVYSKDVTELMMMKKQLKQT